RTVAAVTPGPTCTVTVTLADPPFASVPRLQLTVVVPVHDPCDAAADASEVPAGIGSVTVVFGASDGPMFETPMVYVRSVPAVTGSGVSDLVTARSAVVVTVVVAVAELLPELGSAVDELAVAVLASTVPPATPVPTFTTRAIVADAPFAIDPRLHVTVVVPLQAPCEGTAETNDVPPGIVSVIVTPAAAEGPLLPTVIVYARLLPAPTGSGASVFVTARSAAATTVVVAV